VHGSSPLALKLPTGHGAAAAGAAVAKNPARTKPKTATKKVTRGIERSLWRVAEWVRTNATTARPYHKDTAVC
jgi:hypothetical protein